MKKALFVTVDFINDIVHPDGKIPRCAAMVEEQQTLKHVNKALAWAREQEIEVAHVRVGFPIGYANCPSSSPLFGKAAENEILLLDTWGTEFHRELNVKEDDFIVTKHRVSIFYNTNLESLLRAKQIDTLILCGVSTDMAIETAVREAHDRDYQIFVLGECCAATSVDIHQRTLEGMIAYLAKIRSLSQLKEEFAA